MCTNNESLLKDVRLLRDTPVLVLGYNRPDKIAQLLRRLGELAPPVVIYSVDGPRAHIAGDAQRVAEVQQLSSRITWTDRVETRFREKNVGLQTAVTESVNHAVSQFGQVIVLEEDTLPGPHWLAYATSMLDRHRDEREIMHISGYNVVPPTQLDGTPVGSRLTRYPESIAWATWDRAWQHFDPTLDWGLNASVSDLENVVGTRAGALRWKQNFHDANSGRISTWAYRWISSMWSANGFVLSPNSNLVTYKGYDEGSNTFLKAPWDELDLFDGDIDALIENEPQLDRAADAWVARRVFGETLFGITRGVAVSAVLELRRRRRAKRQARVT